MDAVEDHFVLNLSPKSSNEHIVQGLTKQILIISQILHLWSKQSLHSLSFGNISEVTEITEVNQCWVLIVLGRETFVQIWTGYFC